MESGKKNEDPRKRGYVLERMKQITSSSERAVKWLLYVWLAAIFITLLGVLWYLFQ